MFYLMQNIQSDRIEEILHNDPQDRALASHGHSCIHSCGSGWQRQAPRRCQVHCLQSCLSTLQNQTLLDTHLCLHSRHMQLSLSFLSVDC